MIYRGTTPTHTFALPIDGEICKMVRVIYSQGGKPVLTLDGDRMRVSGKEAACTLTQDETLSLNDDELCEVQMRILTTGGDALISDIIKERVGPCLDNEVLA